MNNIVSFSADRDPKQTNCHVGFYLLPGFSMNSLSALIETMRVVNKYLGFQYYCTKLYSRYGGAVKGSNGIETNSERLCDNAVKRDILFIIGSDYTAERTHENEMDLTPEISTYCHILAGIDSGVEAMLKSGYLNGYRAAVFWKRIADLKVSYKKTRFCDSIFVMDRDRYTIAGAHAGIDLVFAMTEKVFGNELIVSVSDYMCHNVPRSGGAPQSARIAVEHKFVRPVLELMDNHIEDPLQIRDITKIIGISSRHLEREFRREIGDSPSRYYLNKRLSIARNLLRVHGATVGNAAEKTGFSCISTFSKTYRMHFGVSPRSDRFPVS